VSFFVGAGSDGLITATSMLAAQAEQVIPCASDLETAVTAVGELRQLLIGTQLEPRGQLGC
jgi:hypothetical protein